MRDEIYKQIEEERNRQDEKWGQQNHDITLLPAKYAEAMANDLRSHCEEAFAAGEGSWLDILNEELYESMEQAAKKDVDKCRVELIQTAAVLVAMIECLERNGL